MVSHGDHQDPPRLLDVHHVEWEASQDEPPHGSAPDLDDSRPCFGPLGDAGQGSVERIHEVVAEERDLILVVSGGFGRLGEGSFEELDRHGSALAKAREDSVAGLGPRHRGGRPCVHFSDSSLDLREPGGFDLCGVVVLGLVEAGEKISGKPRSLFAGEFECLSSEVAGSRHSVIVGATHEPANSGRNATKG